MNTQVSIFNFKSNQVRTVVINDEPWFVGKDVADALGYANSRDALAKHVDDEDKGVVKLDTLGGAQNITIINESGVYSLVFGSKLATAKEFKSWVTKEVLPTIRKTGSYTAKPVSQLELIAGLATEMVKQEQLVLELKETVGKQASLLDGLQKSFESINNVLVGYVSSRDAHRLYCNHVSYDVFKQFAVNLGMPYESYRYFVSGSTTIVDGKQYKIEHVKSLANEITANAVKVTKHYSTHPNYNGRFMLNI